MPDQTLADLWNEVRSQRRLLRPRAQSRIPRSAAWGALIEPLPRMPRNLAELQQGQERDISGRVARRQAEELGDPTPRTALGLGPRNQVDEAGRAAFEMTGVPLYVRQVARSRDDFQRGDVPSGIANAAGAVGAGGLAAWGAGMTGPVRRPPLRSPPRPARVPDTGPAGAGPLPEWIVRNPTDEQLTGLSGDELKYVMDTDNNVYAFSAADGHHNQAMRALRDSGVSVRPLGAGAEITDPDAAGFIWRNRDGTFSHEDANMVESGPYSAFAQRVRQSDTPKHHVTRKPPQGGFFNGLR